jgi:uncharacterized protein YggU (UPF0235/DUF167 family)
MYIKVHVFPGVKDEGVVKVGEDKLNIKVREKPENGLANNRAKELLAIYMGVIESNVRLIKGAHEPHKIFEIRD